MSRKLCSSYRVDAAVLGLNK